MEAHGPCPHRLGDLSVFWTHFILHIHSSPQESCLCRSGSKGTRVVPLLTLSSWDLTRPMWAADSVHARLNFSSQKEQKIQQQSLASCFLAGVWGVVNGVFFFFFFLRGVD